MRMYLIVALLFLGLSMAAPQTRAQGNVKAGPDPATFRDPELEKDSLHNLEVAKNYFKLKKAYVASLKRCEEILAGNPNFARIDEVLFIAGESSLALAEGKGKQSRSLYVAYDSRGKRTLTPDEFREMSREYLNKLVNDYPQSRYREQAEANLKALVATKTTEPQ